MKRNKSINDSFNFSILMPKTILFFTFLMCFTSFVLGQSQYSYSILEKSGYSLEPASKTSNSNETLSSTFFSPPQENELFYQDWYLESIKINGIHYEKPDLHDVFSYTFFTSSTMFTFMCETGGMLGDVTVDNNNFEINFSNVLYDNTSVKLLNLLIISKLKTSTAIANCLLSVV